jgi:hypothetical protein
MLRRTMFWTSVLAGIKVLTYWETYVAGLEYLAICMLPMVLIGLVAEKGDERGGAAVGCLSVLVLPVFQVAAMAVFVLTLAPIIFGFAEDATWSFPWKILILAPGAFFKLVGVLVVAAIILAFIPLLGQLHSLRTLVLGGIALIFVLSILESVTPGIASKRVDIIPGFWFALGFLVIGSLMSCIGMMMSALVATAFGQLSMVPVYSILGFLPVFMYGAWLGAQVKGGF